MNPYHSREASISILRCYTDPPSSRGFIGSIALTVIVHFEEATLGFVSSMPRSISHLEAVVTELFSPRGQILIVVPEIGLLVSWAGVSKAIQPEYAIDT